MDWETCNYMHLIGIISNDDIDKMIDVMINNCDNNGKCYESYKAEEFLMTHVHNPNLFTIIDEIAHKEIESEENKGRDLSFNDLKEINSFLLKKQICDGILRQIEKEARKKRDYRFFLRLCFGEVVDFEACVSHHPFLGKVEFYKDGGWGIAETDGVVLVKNHLIQQPSEINHQFCGIPYNNIPYRIIQDRDTMKYGIISYESFCETIYCHYDKISICKCCEGSIHHFYIKVKKGVKWGCFDENCALVVDCKYDEIRLVGEYLECSRDCKSLIYDTLEEPGYDTFPTRKHKICYNSLISKESEISF